MTKGEDPDVYMIRLIHFKNDLEAIGELASAARRTVIVLKRYL